MDTDYLVIGSGVAGLTFAVKMAEKFANRNIVIVTKGDEDESNTKYAQAVLQLFWTLKRIPFRSIFRIH